MTLRRAFRTALLSGTAVLNFAGVTGCASAALRSGSINPAPAASLRPVIDKYSACSDDNHTQEKGFALTTGELHFAQSIFEEKFDTTGVRMYLVGSKPSYPKYDASVCLDLESVEFYGTKMRSQDYSLENDLDKYGAFIHEMTHIWQFQGKFPTECTVYKYDLKADSRFSDYCKEQQAAIVEDYARHFLHPRHGRTRPDRGLHNNAKNYRLLAKVVEDQFPQAQKTRLALEAREQPKRSVNTPNTP